MLADGAIHEYEIDIEAIHTDAPGTLSVVIIAADGAGLDKFNAAVRDGGKANPLIGPALSSIVDFTPTPRLSGCTNATYK